MRGFGFVQFTHGHESAKVGVASFENFFFFYRKISYTTCSFYITVYVLQLRIQPITHYCIET